MSGNGVKGMPMDLAERAGRILALPGGPAGALEALSSVRGEGRGEGEAMELLAIDGAATRILSAGEPRAAAEAADRILEALEKASSGSR